MQETTVHEPVRGTDNVLANNIRALKEHRDKEEARASAHDRLPRAITRFAGSMASVYVHIAVFGLWVAINLDLVPGVPAFDEEFVKLATFASIEAIFLTTFVLISQNYAARMAELRADLDLQIGLLSEHEVTRLISLTQAIAQKLDVERARDPELAELQKDVSPERVLDELERADAVKDRGDS